MSILCFQSKNHNRFDEEIPQLLRQLVDSPKSIDLSSILCKDQAKLCTKKQLKQVYCSQQIYKWIGGELWLSKCIEWFPSQSKLQACQSWREWWISIETRNGGRWWIVILFLFVQNKTKNYKKKEKLKKELMSRQNSIEAKQLASLSKQGLLRQANNL